MIDTIKGKRPPHIYAREHAAAQGLTHARLADRMGIAKGTMSKLMNDKMEWTVAYAAAAADALGLASIDDLTRPPAANDAPARVLRRAADAMPAEKVEDAIRVLDALAGTARKAS
jgi:transcriptional regulator with XRE-family HTH domain